MAYRVMYGSGGTKRAEPTRRTSVRGKIWACFFLFLLLVRLYWPAGTEVIRQLLLPGASETAFSSAETLTRELLDGEPLGQALENYCRGILSEAGLSGA